MSEKTTKNFLIFSLLDSPVCGFFKDSCSTKTKNLAEEVVDILGEKLSPIKVLQFADGEVYVSPEEDVRNKDVFVIHSINKPVNDNLMVLLVAIDSLRRAHAKKIHVIIPYYCYARQDRKLKESDPITAKLVANLLTIAGATKISLFDLHSPQFQVFFDVPADHYVTMGFLSKKLVESNVINSENIKDFVLISPDLGGINRVKEFNRFFGESIPIIAIDKVRNETNNCFVQNIYGNPSGKHCVIFDDILDTGNTIIGAAKMLKERGANSVDVVVVHGLFNGKSLENFGEMYKQKIIRKIYITNSTSVSKFLSSNIKNYPFIEVVSIAPLIAELIKKDVSS